MEIKIENVPIIQRKIFRIARKFEKKRISIATNFLESMIEKPFPTRAEVNDIYNACEMRASGLVLAAETAIGNYPKECVVLLKNIIIASFLIQKNTKCANDYFTTKYTWCV